MPAGGRASTQLWTGPGPIKSFNQVVINAHEIRATWLLLGEACFGPSTGGRGPPGSRAGKEAQPRGPGFTPARSPGPRGGADEKQERDGQARGQRRKEGPHTCQPPPLGARGGAAVGTPLSPPSPEGDSPQRDVQGTRPWSFPRSKGGKWLDVVSGGGEPHPAPSSRTGGRAPAPPCLNVRWLLSGGLLSAHWAPTGSPSRNPFASNPVPQFNLEGGKAAPLTGEPALCPLPTRQGEGLSGTDVSYSSFEIHLSWPKG
ncbi:hypothetical protein Cadr_000023542 [Camelus dromedarius]|uniref:Uncharacterized protein n=1 Tax=Camelus dromedarius TaxID=9838 RepID=A0A5N4CVT7_CAMDR|nr:hypothetical protein Cadr_000023542 [Camelus dromedarius]